MVSIILNLLSSVVLFIRRLLGLQVSEGVKAPVTNARRHLFAYHFVHALPTAVAVYLISINLSGRYIGAHLGHGSGSDVTDSIVLAFIQVLAKIHASTQCPSP